MAEQRFGTVWGDLRGDDHIYICISLLLVCCRGWSGSYRKDAPTGGTSKPISLLSSNACCTVAMIFGCFTLLSSFCGCTWMRSCALQGPIVSCYVQIRLPPPFFSLFTGHRVLVCGLNLCSPAQLGSRRLWTACHSLCAHTATSTSLQSMSAARKRAMGKRKWRAHAWELI